MGDIITRGYLHCIDMYYNMHVYHHKHGITCENKVKNHSIFIKKKRKHEKYIQEQIKLQLNYVYFILQIFLQNIINIILQTPHI